MDNYTTSIRFKHVGTTLWSINGRFSEEFVVGFLYGGLLGKYITNADRNYHFEFHAQQTTSSFYKLDAITRKYLDYFVTYVRLFQIDKRTTRNGAQANQYSMWLRFYNPEEANVGQPATAWLVRFRTPRFLQGLLTSLQAFNISSAAVILTAPIKDNTSYLINGEILPDPNEYTDETQKQLLQAFKAAERAKELAELEEAREQRQALGALELED